MKLSFYNYFKTDKDQGLMVYNTRTGASLMLNKRACDLLNHIILPDFDIEYADQETKSFIQQMLNLGVIVQDEQDELNMIRELYYKHVKDGNVLSITLLPTETCNFSCPYCFIYNKRNISMTQDIYDRILKYIANFIDTCKENSVIHLSFFGGEPTLQANSIIKFLKNLKSMISEKDKKIKMDCGIITNGYLLDNKMFRAFLDAGITFYQVTIDGNKDTHDSLRFIGKSVKTFDKIFENLRSISQETKPDDFYTFNIRANFTKKTYDHMPELLDLFVKDFSGNQRFNIYFRPVFKYKTISNNIESIEEDLYSMSEGLQKQMDLALLVQKKMKEKQIIRRIFDPLPAPTLSWCNADKKNNAIIGADGLVYPCETLTGDISNAIGRLLSDGNIEYFENYSTWEQDVFKTPEMRKCLNCKILPICFGGCIRNRREHKKPDCYWSDEIIYSAMGKVMELKKARE